MQKFFDVPGGPELPAVGGQQASNNYLPIDGSQKMTGGLQLVVSSGATALGQSIFADSDNQQRPTWKNSSGELFDLTSGSTASSVTAESPSTNLSVVGYQTGGTLPSGFTAGDLAVGILHTPVGDQQGPVTANWTLEASTGTQPGQEPGTYPISDVYSKVLDGSESGSQLAASFSVIGVFRGADADLIATAFASNDSSSDLTFPVVNPIEPASIMQFGFSEYLQSTLSAGNGIQVESGYSVVGGGQDYRALASDQVLASGSAGSGSILYGQDGSNIEHTEKAAVSVAIQAATADP